MRYLYSWEFILVFKNKCGKDDAFEIGENLPLCTLHLSIIKYLALNISTRKYRVPTLGKSRKI